MRCPRCQHENRPRATFCEECACPFNGVVPTSRSYADLEAELEGIRRALSETLEQQTATGAILRVMRGLPTDIRPVLGAVAEAAMRLCDARDVTIALVEGEVLRVVASHGGLGRW